MILAKRTILVEGPSDELVVQKAFLQTFGKMPLEAGVEVISVNSLAFKRFLDIARLLKIAVSVVTDNDSKTDAKNANYSEYASEENINICIGEDDAYPTLEPQLLKANGLAKLNRILGTAFSDDLQLLAHMKDNKADTALRIFDSETPFDIPSYIQHAIQ
jgi:predicted ATP-dependent endonuclease of OLD family